RAAKELPRPSPCCSVVHNFVAKSGHPLGRIVANRGSDNVRIRNEKSACGARSVLLRADHGRLGECSPTDSPCQTSVRVADDPLGAGVGGGKRVYRSLFASA